MTAVSSGQTVNNSSTPASMQAGQHSMGSSGGPSQQTPGGPPSQQQTDQLMSPAAAGGPQQVHMGQTLNAGTYPPTILSSPIGAPNAAPHYQYVVINQQGQAVLQPANMSFPGMTTMPTATAQQPGQQYIITTGLPQQAKQGSQQTQLMTSGAAVSMTQTVSKSMAQPTYTLTSSGLVSQTGAPQQTFIMAHQMGGSPTLQAPGSNMVTTTSMPSHIKAEPGKQMQQGTQQPQQVSAQQPMILPGGVPGVAYMNAAQAAPGQAFIQNGQIFVRAPGPQDGQGAPQIMFPQAGMMQPQTLQPAMNTQQLPPGLTTSMQPMTSMAASGGSTVVRAPVGYPSQPPSGKTQISRAPPTLLPATSTSSNSANRMTTSSAFITQPSPKSKQKMSPRPAPLSAKSMSSATKSILNNIKNQVGSSVSPPVLTSSASPLPLPGSPSAGGPPVLQTSLTAPPPHGSNSHSQPPLLQPMMIPTSGSNITGSYVNGKPVTIAPTLGSSGGFKNIDTSGKVPIMPSIKKATTAAAPMEPISKMTDSTSTNGGRAKPPQECLTHVIDGHVIHESSKPFPLEDDSKGRNNRKNKSETKNDMPNSTGTPVVNSRPLGSLPSTPVLPPPPRLDPSEKKRGPGRPPGSTKQNIEQQRLLQQQQLQSNADIVKVNNKEPVTKKAKLDFEPGPPSLTSAVAPSSQNSVAPKQPGLPLPPTKTNTESEVKSKYNIDVVHNNPLKWNVNQVCDFVKNLPGCSDYVEDFQLQEIDGQALMLLKADHLMSAMAIKLGPALKICNAIEAMREELKQN